jgi:dihydrofolate reductase
MRNLTLIVHTSLDGFVAGINGELSGFEAAEENLEFVAELCQTADAALFGRVSYELLNQYWPSAKDHPGATKGEVSYSEWYNIAEKIVFSRTMDNDGPGHPTIINGNILEEISRIKDKPGKDIFIFGSPSVAQTLMNLDFIDKFWIFVNPVIFGKGIPLFNPPQNSSKLRLTETKQFNNGELALHYEVIR